MNATTTPGSNPFAWIRGNDTGTSSKTIWSVMTGQHLWESRPDVPHDPADFGRCYRLLLEFPHWEARLPEVAAAYPAWGPFVRGWETLKALYAEESPSGRCPKLFVLMQALVDEGRNL